MLSKKSTWVHLQSHENKREFECKVCDKAFNTKKNLSNHQRFIHLSTRNFKCPECEKSFKRIYDLKKHSIVHSEIRNFECPICGKLFKRNSCLQSHLMTHSYVNPQWEIWWPKNREVILPNFAIGVFDSQ